MQKVHFILKDQAGEPAAILDFLKVEANGGTELFMPKWGGWMSIPYPIKENRTHLPFYFTGIENCDIHATKYFCLGVEITPEMVKSFWEWYDNEILPVKTFLWNGNGGIICLPGKTKEEVLPFFQKMEDADAIGRDFQPKTVLLEDIKEIRNEKNP